MQKKKTTNKCNQTNWLLLQDVFQESLQLPGLQLRMQPLLRIFHLHEPIDWPVKKNKN